MPKRYCKCPNEHCFDRATQCESCDPEDLDPEGYPRRARRRLTNEENGMVVDIDTKQEFRVKTVKGGKRLVPQFKGRMDWKSTKGFAAMLLILSCLGAEGEYVLWDEATGTEMTEKEWHRRGYKKVSKPPIRHRVCGEVVTSSKINGLQQGQSIGCSCNFAKLNHWRNRRDEVVQWGEERGFEVLTTEEEWVDECDGKSYKPKFKCLECKEVVTSTTVNHLQTGQSIGCSCNSTHANHWRHRRAEVAEWGTERGFEVLTTEEEWVDECDGNSYKPKFKCLECEEEVTSTRIGDLQQGKSIGCSCNSSHANHWRYRRAEVVEWGEERGFEVLTTEEDWVKECDGWYYCPKFKCLKCEDVVSSTTVSHLQTGGGIGCSCNSSHANHWRHRRAEVVEWGQERFFEVLTTEEEWVDECDGKSYKPKFKCLECKEVVTSTTVNHLQTGGGIGCSCQNKTERKLHEWLQNKFPEATVTRQYPGPKTEIEGQTHFDFLLAFPDGFEVLIELDGPQHFWKDERFYTVEGCKRDLIKEEWAVAKELSVVRVLQEDVWDDLLDWQGWVSRSIQKARTVEARPITPDAPEYMSSESEYVRLRSPGRGWAVPFWGR